MNPPDMNKLREALATMQFELRGNIGHFETFDAKDCATVFEAAQYLLDNHSMMLVTLSPFCEYEITVYENRPMKSTRVFKASTKLTPRAASEAAVLKIGRE